MTFRGVLPILTVPCLESGEIHYESVRTQIAALADGGCDGVILFGFGSEFYKLTDEERRELTRVSVDAGETNDLPVYTSVTAQTTREAVNWAEWYEEAGVDGLMVLPPHMSSPSEAETLDHLRALADAVSLPVMVQYAPQNVGLTISPSTFVELSEEVENVAHYKVECQPPGPYMTDLLEGSDGEVDVLVGSGGKKFIEALDRGAIGVIPSGGLHEFYVEIWDRYTSGDRMGAIEVHNELLPMLNTSYTGEGFVHYDKKAQARRGFIDEDATHVRSPTAYADEYVDALWEDQFELALEFIESL